MQPEQQRKLSLTHQNLWVLKNRPYTHTLQGTEVTYSILHKKQKTFLLSHERFLYLNGIESISYASTAPPEQSYPIKDPTALPRFKATYPLAKIKSVVTVEENLIIQFSGSDNPKWEFVCTTKECAKAWKQKIQSALKALKEMLDGKFASYADYLKHKQSQPPITNDSPNPSPKKPVLDNPPSPQKKLHPLVFNDQLNKTTTPVVATFNGPVLYPNVFQTAIVKPVIPQPSNIDKLLRQIDSLRRNWLEQWVQGENEEELILSFRHYSQKVAEVIILELPYPNNKKIPPHELTKQFGSYLFRDIHLELYFLHEDNLYTKHSRYQKALKQFKNLDHLVSSTRNIGPLRSPLLIMFEYKGILGSVKTRGADSVPFRNRELYQILDHPLFQEETKISTEVFLNESKTKIVKYEGKLPPQSNQVYIIERLAQFLPTENDQSTDSNLVLRTEFVHDEDLEFLDNVIFRDRNRPVHLEAILNELESKVKYFVEIVEEEEEYFTNSKELAELFHFYGLNMRHLGLVLRHSTKNWLKRIIRSEIVSRSLKNYLRVELQRSVVQNTSQNDFRERKIVIDLLNVFLGNSQNTQRLWNNLSTYSKQYFHAPISPNDLSDYNIPYLLQALQSNLHIVLQEQVLSKLPFRSNQTLQESDFVGFEFNSRIFDLQFTDSFEVINDCLLDRSPESFQNLCELLISQNPRTNQQLIKILQTHPIHLRIYEYLLNFTSPDQSFELYNKAQASYRPNRFLYEAKLAEIKWYLKADQQDKITQAVNFFTDHVKRWLGDIHPLLTQVYRHLAQYFCDIRFYYDKAIQAANASLAIQQALFQGDSYCLWRDYFLVGKIHFANNNIEQALKYLPRAKLLAKVNDQNDYQVYGELCLVLAKCYKATRLYKEAYTTIKEFFEVIKNQTDEQSLAFILEAAFMIQHLLEISQEYELFLKFLETDFLNVMVLLLNQSRYLPEIIKMATIPSLKNVVLQKSKHRGALLQILTEVSQIKQQPSSGEQYLRMKIRHGKFPREYFTLLRQLDSIIEQINNNEILMKWVSYNRIAGYNLLHMVGDKPINRSFEFLCYLSALFNYLGSELLAELSR